ATDVTFDGLAATSVLVVNGTTVTAITPAHVNGAVDVVILTPQGSATLADGYTYTGPTITEIDWTTGSEVGGLGVTVTGTGLTGATSLTFDGYAATSVNVVNATTVTAVTPAHVAGAVDVAIATPEGEATLINGFIYVATAVGQRAFGGIIAALDEATRTSTSSPRWRTTARQFSGAASEPLLDRAPRARPMAQRTRRPSSQRSATMAESPMPHKSATTTRSTHRGTPPARPGTSATTTGSSRRTADREASSRPSIGISH